MAHPRRKHHRVTTKYNNQLLYFAQDAADYHFKNRTDSDPNCLYRNIPHFECNGNCVRPLYRVQSINYAINTNLVNINQYGQAARFDAAMSSSPDVTIDFEYILADGYNEQVLGFALDGKSQALSKFITADNKAGGNFFLAVAPEGHNIVGAPLSKFGDDLTVVGIGNAFLSQYAVIAEVGNVPRARVSFDAFNINSNFGYCNLPVPSVDMVNDCKSSMKFSLPDTYEVNQYPKLKGLDDIEYQNLIGGIRPSDIKIYMGDSALITKTVNSASLPADGSAHIQGFSINVPIGTTKVNRVGSSLGFRRNLNFPSSIEIEVNAILSEIKAAPDLVHSLTCKKPVDIILDLTDCKSLVECEGVLENRTSSMRFVVKNVLVEEESFDLNLSDSKIVKMKFTSSVAGNEDLSSGLFISAKSYMPDRPQILAWGHPL